MLWAGDRGAEKLRGQRGKRLYLPNLERRAIWQLGFAVHLLEVLSFFRKRFKNSREM